MIFNHYEVYIYGLKPKTIKCIIAMYVYQLGLCGLHMLHASLYRI